MTWDSYPRDQLIADIAEMLLARGIHFEFPPERTTERRRAATALLSSMSVIPTLSPEDALDLDGHARYNRIVHGD